MEPLLSSCPNPETAHISVLQRMVWLPWATGRAVRGTEVLPPWKGEREGPSFPALTSLCGKRNLSRRANSNSLEGQDGPALCTGAGGPCCPFIRTSVPRFRVCSQTIQPLHPSLPSTPRSACPLHLGSCGINDSPRRVPNTGLTLSHLIHTTR